MKENKFNDVATILHKQKQELIKTDLENERKRYIKVFSDLYPSNNPKSIEDIINSSQLDTKEAITDITQRIFTHLISVQSSDLPLDTTNFGEDWFSQSVEGLDIPQNINEWLRDGKLKSENEDNIYELLDLTQLTSKKSEKSIHYAHKNLSSREYFKFCLACENGLITPYARSTIINMLKVWSNDDSTLFPLENFQDYSILKLVDYQQNW
jgi:hypothetical protein